mmetsp:Transcript_9282/g.22710  ORF Transcript_9282/g.22710 Transcript_9282/m.22710 type:complete len:93 (+) Transcript_9282:2-280(+)
MNMMMMKTVAPAATRRNLAAVTPTLSSELNPKAGLQGEDRELQNYKKVPLKKKCKNVKFFKKNKAICKKFRMMMMMKTPAPAARRILPEVLA